VDFAVHRSGDIGSPRVVGSTSASNAAARPGSATVADLRPPPERRDRPGSSTSGLPNSATAVVIVERATPVTRATAETPPQPSSRASAPNNAA